MNIKSSFVKLAVVSALIGLIGVGEGFRFHKQAANYNNLPQVVELNSASEQELQARIAWESIHPADKSRYIPQKYRKDDSIPASLSYVEQRYNDFEHAKKQLQKASTAPEIAPYRVAKTNSELYFALGSLGLIGAGLFLRRAQIANFGSI